MFGWKAECLFGARDCHGCWGEVNVREVWHVGCAVAVGQGNAELLDDIDSC